MDVKMPVLNGFETATLIYEREKLRHIPIIFVTANNYGDENVFKGYRAGGIDYIFKPINPEVLRAKVAVFIDLYKKNNLLFEQEQKLAATNKSLEIQINDLKASSEKARQLNLKLTKEISNLEYILVTSRLSIDKSEFVQSDLNAILKSVLAELDDQVIEKMATVSIDPLPSLRVSPILIRPLFQNLIRNALKNSRMNINPIIKIHSETEVSATTLNSNNHEPRRYCRIFVEDNGAGFDQRNAVSIFNLPDTSHKSELNGFNGLALCKKIMDEHGGFIAAKGKVDEGSTFIISLPMP